MALFCQVRQLEALVRLSEALAKITLSNNATEEHVAEAIRLFHVSTLNAAASGVGEAAIGCVGPSDAPTRVCNPAPGSHCC